MSNQKQFKPLSWKKIGLLTVSAILIVLGRALIECVVSILYVNGVINGAGFAWVDVNLFALSWVVRGVGIAVLCVIGFKTRFHVDRAVLKQRLFKSGFLVVLVVGLLFLGTFAEAPLVSAAQMNTMSQGWKICTSFGLYDWWIGNLSDNTYFAMRGSDGNVMTFVEPWQKTAPWAAYTTNSSALVQNALAALTTGGTVYLKDVVFDYVNCDFTIPADVRVIEDVKGLQRNFVASSESTGSPYTVSVDTVNPTYYLCQDSEGRFIDSWSSTNCATVYSNCINAGGLTHINTGNYTFTSGVTITHKGGFVLEGDARGGYLVGAHPRSTVNLIKDFDGVLFTFYPSETTWNTDNSFTLRNFEVTSDGIHSGDIFDMNYVQEITLENIKATQFNGTGLKINHGTAMSFNKVRMDDIRGANYGLWFNDTNDWQTQYLESNANQQSAGYCAFWLNYSQGQVFGGHFEGWRNVEASNLVGELEFIGTQFSFTQERSVLVYDTQVTIQNCFFLGANQGEFVGEAGSELYIASNYATVIGNVFSSDKATYSVYTNSSGNSFVGNDFTNKPVYASGNHNEFTGGNRFIYALTIGSFTSVVGNYVGSSITALGTYNEVDHNTGYVTENSGYLTFPNGETTYSFPHNLAGRPLYDFTLSWKEAVTAGVQWQWTSNATHITVTLTSAADGDGWAFTWTSRYRVGGI